MSNGIKTSSSHNIKLEDVLEQNPTEIKRRGYLAFFKDGVADGLLSGIIDDNKRSSSYYKQGYNFGLVMYASSRLDMSAEMENEHALSKVKK